MLQGKTPGQIIRTERIRFGKSKCFWMRERELEFPLATHQLGDWLMANSKVSVSSSVKWGFISTSHCFGQEKKKEYR